MWGWSGGEVIPPGQWQRYPDDQDPLDKGQSEATDGAVASCDGVGQAEGEAEADPVEQEGHCRGRDTGEAKSMGDAFWFHFSKLKPFVEKTGI